MRRPLALMLLAHALYLFNATLLQWGVRLDLFRPGVALYQAPATIEQTIDQADQALYRAKAEGRDRICLATPDAPARHAPAQAPSPAQPV